MADEEELEDHLQLLIAGAIQAAAKTLPAAVLRDFPPDAPVRPTLEAYLRSNSVSDHLADAALAALEENGFQIVRTPRKG